MIFQMSNKIDDIGSAVKNDIFIMIFIVFVSLLNFGICIHNAISAIGAGIIFVVYVFFWKKMKSQNQYALVGFSNIVISVTLFVMGFRFANIQNYILAVSIISLYLIEFSVVMYYAAKSKDSSETTSNKPIKFSTAFLLSCSSIGVILARYFERVLSDDITLLMTAIIFICISYLFIFGCRYIVLLDVYQ